MQTNSSYGKILKHKHAIYWSNKVWITENLKDTATNEIPIVPECTINAMELRQYYRTNPINNFQQNQKIILIILPAKFERHVISTKY